MFRRVMGQTNFALRQGLISIIQLYQYLISPLLGSRCRFYPSCSQYAVDALSHYNVLKALLVISKRVLCCQPLHPGGYDPIAKKAVEVKGHGY